MEKHTRDDGVYNHHWHPHPPLFSIPICLISWWLHGNPPF